MTVSATSRPDRSHAMDVFLSDIGWGGATRSMLAGDASFRRYERVSFKGRVAVLMDAPPPWEDVAPFIAVSRQLAAWGVSVPDIIAVDENQGFLLLEDFGDALFTRVLKAHPAQELELYAVATDALAVIHRQSVHTDYDVLPPYAMPIYLREASLLVEWFLPQVMGLEKARALLPSYRALWQGVIEGAGLVQTTLVHRDYHADNLLWLQSRTGHQRVGMLDYQDALLGDPVYDLVSLLEDARRDVHPATVAACKAQCIEALAVDVSEFDTRYAVLAAQRNAKIIGIFMRLTVRDGKAQYLNYLPRVWAHFMHDLAHPALEPIRAFVEAHVPHAMRGIPDVDVSIGGLAPCA